MATTKLIADVDEVLTTTRAVRRRLDLTRPVPRELVEECVVLAQQSTMSSNQENWRFIAVDEPEVKERIAELYRQTWIETVEEPLKNGDPATVARLADRKPGEETERQGRIVNGVKFLVDRIEQVPVLMFVCSVSPLPREGVGSRTSGYYGTVFPAAWSLALALRSRGLGSVMATAIVHKAEELKTVLGLPENCQPITMLPVAFTKGLDFKVAVRAELDEVMAWNGWADKLEKD